nr:MAG TPA: hypothetical protein [Caudoviricetes sp.]
MLQASCLNPAPRFRVGLSFICRPSVRAVNRLSDLS